MSIRRTVTSAALAFAMAAYAPAVANSNSSPAPLWSLVKTAAGHDYVVDYDLSVDDCYEAMMAAPKVVGRVTFACERQPLSAGKGE